jgi:hypothetical protein
LDFTGASLITFSICNLVLSFAIDILQLVIALGQLIIALAIAGWYFTKDKSSAGNGMVLWVSLYTSI